MSASQIIRSFFLVLIAYLICHLAIQLFLLPGTLGTDFVEQAIFAQHLDFAYGIKQPPLYTWLQLGLNNVIGNIAISYPLLKYIIFALWISSFFFAVRVWSGSWHWAFFGSGCLFLLYQVAWKAHFGVTHTFLLSFAVCQTLIWIGLIRKAEKTSPIFYIMLGLSIAVGIYAKHSYWLFLMPLLLCIFIDHHITQKPKLFLISGSVAALLVAPWILEVLTQLPTLAQTADASSTGPDTLQRLKNVSTLITETIGFLSPLWLIILVVLLISLRQNNQPFADLFKSRPDAGFSDRHFLHRLGLVIFIGAAFAIVIFGLPGFKARWMHPLLMAALIWMVLFCKSFFENDFSEAQTKRFQRIVWYIIAVITVLIIVLRLLQTIYGPPFCKRCRLLEPMPNLAAELHQKGLSPTHIFALDDHTAGNLAVFMPNSRVYTPHYPYVTTPIGPKALTDAAECLVIWRLTSDQIPTEMPKRLSDYVGQFGVSSPKEQVQILSLDWPFSRKRASKWAYQFSPHCQLSSSENLVK